MHYRNAAAIIIGIFITATVPATAQQYGYDDQCRPLTQPGWMMQPQPPSESCLAQRAQAARAAEAEIKRRQIQADAQAAAEAARQQEMQQQQAEAARQQTIRDQNAAFEQARTRRAVFENQRAAELSPDNHCKEHDIARRLLEDWSNFKTNRENDLTAIDIEHLTTVRFIPGTSEMTCHGVFVINNGVRLIGTMQIKPNVAGDLIIVWTRDYSQDLSQFDEPPIPVEPVAPPPLQTPVVANQPSSSLPTAQGLADRRQWEVWHDSLAGDELAGATWWSAQRSLRHPGSCADTPADRGSAWTKGCLEAKQMLAPFDSKRRSDPDYRVGWNSY